MYYKCKKKTYSFYSLAIELERVTSIWNIRPTWSAVGESNCTNWCPMDVRDWHHQQENGNKPLHFLEINFIYLKFKKINNNFNK